MRRTKNGTIKFGKRTIDMYKFHSWLSTYNRIEGTRIRPRDATEELVTQYTQETPKPFSRVVK